MRDVLVKKGFAYVHKDVVDAIVMTEFRAKLSKNLGLAAKRWNAFVVSSERARLVPLINSLRTKELGRLDARAQRITQRSVWHGDCFEQRFAAVGGRIVSVMREESV